MTLASLADRIRAAVPDARCLDAGDYDRQAPGAQPRASIAVHSPEAVAALLALADRERWAVAPRGGGTMLDLGNPLRSADIALDLHGLDQVVDYQPDDLTLTMQAGVTLGAIQRLLAPHGQMLALDVPLPAQATVGGALATNVSGPRRLRYGTARDLVLGMQFALPQGGLARTGGKVVKNVSGYDLAKMHIGALGTLGVITEVTFKLWPSPVARAAVFASFPSLKQAVLAAGAVVHSQFFPTAVELLNQPAADKLVPLTVAGAWILVLVLESIEQGVARQVRDARALLADYCEHTAMIEHHQVEDDLLEPIRGCGREAATLASLILRAAVLPSQIGLAVDALQQAGALLGAAPSIVARPGAGVALGHWTRAAAQSVAPAVAQARQSLAKIDGTLTVERAPARATLEDVWGIEGPDLALMRRLKQTYDPRNVLNPGRYARGI